MSRNVFGNGMVLLFALLVFTGCLQYERYHHGATAPFAAVVVPALWDTLLVVGAVVCAMLVGLHFVRKQSANKPND